MTRERLECTRRVVKKILEDDEFARNSDSWLYLKVIEEDAKRMGINLENVLVKTFLAYPQGFTPFETVQRTRRFIQRQFPELAGNRRIKQKRAQLEEEYRDWARGCDDGLC